MDWYVYIVTIKTHRYVQAQKHYTLALHFKITLMIEMEYNKLIQLKSHYNYKKCMHQNIYTVARCLQCYEYTVLCFFMKTIILTGLNCLMTLSTLCLPALNCTFLLPCTDKTTFIHFTIIASYGYICMAKYTPVCTFCIIHNIITIIINS